MPLVVRPRAFSTTKCMYVTLLEKNCLQMRLKNILDYY